MINSKQYEALCYIHSHPTAYAKNVDELIGTEITESLQERKHIQYREGTITTKTTGMWAGCEQDYEYAVYEVTQDGYSAIEEYETQQRAEARDEEAIRIAKEANAKSDTANSTAKCANFISIIAGAIAALTLLAQVFDWKLPNSKNSAQSYSETQQSNYQSDN